MMWYDTFVGPGHRRKRMERDDWEDTDPINHLHNYVFCTGEEGFGKRRSDAAGLCVPFAHEAGRRPCC